MKVFIVVDVMYPYVTGDEADFIQRVADATKAAREDGCFVCLLEHVGPAHTTHSAITEQLSGYPYCEVIQKRAWDGSQWLHERLEAKQITPSEFVVCGAISEQCVLSTAQGLRARYPRLPITLLPPACLNLRGNYDWQPAASLHDLQLSDKF